jgi:ATP-binding cassette subfamily B protein
MIVLLIGSSLIAFAPLKVLALGTVLLIFYSLVFIYSRGQLRIAGAEQVLKYQRSVQIAQEGLGGIRDVLLDRNQKTFIQAYRESNRSRNLAEASINIIAQVPRYLIEGFVVILIVGLTLIQALQGQGIEQQLPILGVLSLGVYRMLQPLQKCFGSVTKLQANQLALRRLSPFLMTQQQKLDVEESQSLALDLRSEHQLDGPMLEMQNVSFRYSDELPWVLKDLNLTIQPGERLAFVGTTGSGKSTTIDLILGMLQPNEGKLLACGQDLFTTPGLLTAWQDQVAHVPQQIFLSDASYAANIAFGLPENLIDLQLVRSAAKQAHVAELIESSPYGYNTIVGERGIQLSGGQRQRIGIARALYKRAQLLVLDEATSALDNRTEAEVMNAIESLDRTITIILIAHRLSTVKRSDKIVVLDGGRISGCGSYQQLYETNKLFRNMALISTNAK